MSAQIPFAILSTSTGDIDLSQGIRFTSTMPQYVGQRLRQNLSFMLGEWFLDQRQGVPWRQRFTGQRFDKGLLESCLRKVALGTAGVASVKRLRTSFDRRTRVVSVPEFIAICNDGSQVTQDDMGLPLIINLVSAVQT